MSTHYAGGPPARGKPMPRRGVGDGMMTPEREAEIREVVARAWPDMCRHQRDLLAEIDRLRAEVERLKEEGDVFLRNLRERDAEVERLTAAWKKEYGEHLGTASTYSQSLAQAEADAERLAEALRFTLTKLGPLQVWPTEAKVALRQHEEGK